MTTNKDICKKKRESEIEKLVNLIPPSKIKLYASEIRKLKRKNLYKPHQGEKECARNLKQLEKERIKKIA